MIASSGADVGGALAGAVASLSGPLHGGAIGRVPSMLEAIGDPSRVEPWIRDRLARGERLMGFGHAVYRTLDPRNLVLRGVAEEIGGDTVELAKLVEETGVRLLNEKKSDKRREANIELYAGMALDFAGVPEEMFGSTFTVARMAGWTANLMEQIADNRIFRPAARYVGREPAHRVMSDEIIAAQRAYYDERAPDYSSRRSRPIARSAAGFPSACASELIDAFAPTGDVLELACGSGTLTQDIVRHARTLTCVDGSPRMLERNRETIGERENVRYVLADIFDWTPDRTYDEVFFSALAVARPGRSLRRFLGSRAAMPCVPGAGSPSSTRTIAPDATSRRGSWTACRSRSARSPTDEPSTS